MQLNNCLLIKASNFSENQWFLQYKNFHSYEKKKFQQTLLWKIGEYNTDDAIITNGNGSTN